MRALLSVGISGGLLTFLYWRIDGLRLFDALLHSDAPWLASAVGLIVPLTMIAAERLRVLVPGPGGLSRWEANRLILQASTLNILLPSRAGDIAKAYYMADRSLLRAPQALAVVIFEKLAGLAVLLLWGVVALLIHPEKADWFWLTVGVLSITFAIIAALLVSARLALRILELVRLVTPRVVRSRLTTLMDAWREMHAFFWRDPRRVGLVVTVSVGLWFLHFLQMWMFVLALHGRTPLGTHLALAVLASLAGALPFTFAGAGTRDAALLVLYRPYLDPSAAAALGVLCTLRYLLPAIAGVPFVAGHRATRA